MSGSRVKSASSFKGNEKAERLTSASSKRSNSAKKTSHENDQGNSTVTQTEWSWLRDRNLMERIKKGEYLIDGTDNVSIRGFDTDSSDDQDDLEIIQKSKSSILDSVGPPKILQYIPENRKSEETPERSDSAEFLVDDIKDINKFMQDFSVYIKGDHPCEFCSANVRPWPSIEDQENKDPKELYCCEDYREYVQALFDIYDEKNSMGTNTTADLINIDPHPKSKNKKDIKLAKERAKKRAQERKIEEVKKEEELWKKEQQLLTQASDNCSESSERTKNFTGAFENAGKSRAELDKAHALKLRRMKSPYVQTYRHESIGSLETTDEDGRLSKQLRSINFQLSNVRHMRDGWTVQVPTPFAFEDIFNDDHEEILVPVRVPSSVLKLHERPLLTKFYKNGNICLILFSDGTGNVFYKSGGVAISITLASRGMHVFTAFSEHEFNPVLLAMFDPYGNGYCNYLTGKLRLSLSQNGGVEFDDDNTDRRRRWLWWNYNKQHVHAPPIQPVIFMLSHNLSVKVHSQEKIYLTFSSGSHTLNFNVGSKLQLTKHVNANYSKVVRPDLLPHSFKLDSSETLLARNKDRIQDLLRLIQEDLTRSAVLVRSNVNKLPKLISNTESFLTQVGQFKSSLTDYTQQNSEIEKQAKQTILNEKKLSKRTTSKQGSKFVSVP